jgi:hypothetical protein
MISIRCLWGRGRTRAPFSDGCARGGADTVAVLTVRS